MGKYSSSTQLYYYCIYCRILYVSSLSLISPHSFSFIPFQVCVSHRFGLWWIKSSFQNSRGLSSNILVYPLGIKTCFQCYVIFLDLIYPFVCSYCIILIYYISSALRHNCLVGDDVMLLSFICLLMVSRNEIVDTF